MEVAITLAGWQFLIALALSQKPGLDPRLKLPTLDEIKQTKKEAYRRFRQSIKAMAHHR
ncbi:unnamed protein product [marine sediment metagenome]|uniref:Uncharacterized protein n=1 Tax=marine sediment metagenome TaxID=412755 RepID=X1N6L9_9ZZZZ